MSEIFFAWAQSKVDNISTYRDQTYTSKYTGTSMRNQTYNSNHTGTGGKPIILSICTGTNRDYNRDQIYTSKYLVHAEIRPIPQSIHVHSGNRPTTPSIQIQGANL